MYPIFREITSQGMSRETSSLPQYAVELLQIWVKKLLDFLNDVQLYNCTTYYIMTIYDHFEDIS